MLSPGRLENSRTYIPFKLVSRFVRMEKPHATRDDEKNHKKNLPQLSAASNFRALQNPQGTKRKKTEKV
jgi:hypothetical protein